LTYADARQVDSTYDMSGRFIFFLLEDDYAVIISIIPP
jgi:hypothetical protein